MPFLTPQNLPLLAEGARMFHYACLYATPPTSHAMMVARRPAATGRRAFVHVFGPVTKAREDEPKFRHHHSTGLVDCLSIERMSVAEIDRDVVTIEQHLAEVLAEYPAVDGWEVVVVNHLDPESTTLVNDAGRLDGDARACLERVYGR